MIATRFNPLGKDPPKPYAYQVEYLESTGSQYVDTGYSLGDFPNVNEIYTKAKCDVLGFANAATYFGANHSYLFGVQANGIYYYSNNVRWDSGIQEIEGVGTGSSWGWFFNGVKKGSVGWNYGYNDHIYLFAGGRPIVTPANYFKGRIYSALLRINGQDIFDCIMVVDKQGIPCVYNKVTGQLLYNQGTGEFIAGERV